MNRKVSVGVHTKMPTSEEIDQHFDSLVGSAFDFVEQAISSFADHERISLFLFATGLELFTKARLYQEHWSLIFANVDQAEFRRFETGDLKSVGAEKANDRIKQILGHNLPASFEVIRQHRNRIAHFTHGSTEEQRTEIVSHQVQGWFDLYHLLRNDWKPTFKKYRKRYNELEKKMRKHREFLEAKYQAIQSDLEEERSAGNQIHLCPACKYEAMSVWLLGGVIHHGNCRVCGRLDNYVGQPCIHDDCGHPIGFLASDGAPEHCPECEEAYAEHLKVALDTDPISVDDYQSRSEINCPYCSGYHSVVTHYDGYVCTECFEYEEEIGFCGWCADGQLGGVGKLSEWSGCEFCDGKAGWDRD